MQRIAASPHLLFMCVLGPLFFRSSSLYQLVLTRSRSPQMPKANHFLAYLALLAGPKAFSHPVTAQNSLGRAFPPTAPPPAPLRGALAGLRPAREAPKKSPAFGGRQRATAVQDAPHSKFHKKCHVLIPCRCAPPNMAVVEIASHKVH